MSSAHLTLGDLRLGCLRTGLEADRAAPVAAPHEIGPDFPFIEAEDVHQGLQYGADPVDVITLPPGDSV